MSPTIRVLIAALLTLLLNAAPAAVHSQTLGTPAGAIYYPGDLNEGEIKMGAGLSTAKPPDAAVEEASDISWPMFEFLIRYGLPEHFEAVGKVSTQIVTNHVAIGARWTYDLHPWAFAVGYDFAFIFGRLEQYGFNNTVFGTFSYPNLQVGYDFAIFTITLRGELNIVNHLSASTDGVELTTDGRIFNGGAVAAFLEQPLWKDNYFTIGFKANFVKFYYPTWLLFPTFHRYFYVPELVFGLRI